MTCGSGSRATETRQDPCVTEDRHTDGARRAVADPEGPRSYGQDEGRDRGGESRKKTARETGQVEGETRAC